MLFRLILPSLIKLIRETGVQKGVYKIKVNNIYSNLQFFANNILIKKTTLFTLSLNNIA